MNLSKKERKARKEEAPRMLSDKGITYEVKNNGSHIVVKTPLGDIDWWPSTDHGNDRRGLKIVGFSNLVDLVGKRGGINKPQKPIASAEAGDSYKITVRQNMAIAALQELVCQDPDHSIPAEFLAARAVALADALIAQLDIGK